MEEFGQVYKGTSYRLLTNNCNHFTREVCKVLTEKEIPRWVNRLAGIAVSCPCVSATEEDLCKLLNRFVCVDRIVMLLTRLL